MKPEYKVFEQNLKKTVNLRLIDEGDTISLVAVNGEGLILLGGYLISLDKNTGKFHLPCPVNPDLGFPLDHSGCIAIGD